MPGANDGGMTARRLPADAAERWDDGLMSGSSTPTTEAEVIVRDGGLMLYLQLVGFGQGTESDVADYQTALLAVAENIREAMRRPG